MLASVPKNVPATEADLEKAKARLSSGSWAVGVFSCLPSFYKLLSTLAGVSVDASQPYLMPQNEHATTSASAFLEDSVLAEVAAANYLDDALYEWVLQQGTIFPSSRKVAA